MRRRARSPCVVADGLRAETSWNGPLGLSPASIRAVKPGVSDVTVITVGDTVFLASSTSPTPALPRLLSELR